MKPHRSHLQFRTQRSFRAVSEHDCTARGLRQVWHLIWKFRTGIALVCLITLPIMAIEAQTPTDSAEPPATSPAPPPSGPAKLGAAELEKLLMPIALYPDALIATLLPASVYPLEIVQAARFLQDSNNVSQIDQQPWDDSVKAIAKIPAALKKLNDDINWTIQLGEVFVNQDKDVMDMIQSLRMKAQKAGTLRTTEQQVVVVTNMIVESKVEEKVVVVTNTVVQIQPSAANPQVVYVPSYPSTVYYPPPAYVYDPLAPLITFGAGVAVGAIVANNVDWHHGGCYHGGNVNIDQNVNVNRGGNTINSGNRTSQQAGGKKWQPDANRVRSSGSGASAKTMESRGWGSGSAGTGGARPSAQLASGRPGGATTSTRPSTTSTGTRPSTSSARPSASPSASTRQSTPSAFGGGGGSDRQASSRGASSRSGGGTSRGGGGGSRGGGGGRR